VNTVSISGYVAGNSDLQLVPRRFADSQKLLAFHLDVIGHGKDSSPVVRVGYFPKPGEPCELKAGTHVFVSGELRHRREGLYVAASEVLIFASRTENESRPEVARAAQ